MAYERIMVQLTTEERGALLQIAELECRDPREQVRFLVRKEAQQRGLIAFTMHDVLSSGSTAIRLQLSCWRKSLPAAPTDEARVFAVMIRQELIPEFEALAQAAEDRANGLTCSNNRRR